MSIRKLLIAFVATLGLFAAFGASMTSTATAQDDRGGRSVNRQDAVSQLRTVPAAPKADRSMSLAAASPSMYGKAPERNFYLPADGYNCAYGRLCVEVWDPTVSRWEVFIMYSCGRYRLANWHGGGLVINNQTTGTVARFYGQSDSNKVGETGRALWIGTADWGPVWSIVPC